MAYVYAAMAGLQLLSGIQQANSIQKQAELSKKINDFNIEQSELDAYLAEQEGYTQQARYQNVIDQLNADQKVALQAENVDANFGSMRDIQAESNLNAELNMLDIQTSAHMKALGYKRESNQMRTQGRINQIEADYRAGSVRNAALINAAGTGLRAYEHSSNNTGYENKKGEIKFGKPIKGGADNFNYDAYYGFAPRSRS